jgi:O-antigen/teichoic acid export membrane protein
LFPRFSAIAAKGHNPSLRDAYEKGLQVVAVLAIPAGLSVALFSFEILTWWTGSSRIGEAGWLALSLLAVASILNAIQNPAYNLLLAVGQTRIVLAVGLANAAAAILLTSALAPRWGVSAAAAVWLGQNVLCAGVYPRAAMSIASNTGRAGVLTADIWTALLLGLLAFGLARLAAAAGGASVVMSLAFGMSGYFLGVAFLGRFRGYFGAVLPTMLTSRRDRAEVEPAAL